MPHHSVPAAGSGGAEAPRSAEGRELNQFRSRVVGLPLQASTFARVDQAATMLGFDDAAFDACLDESGSLSVTGVEALTAALVGGLDADSVERMRAVVNAVVDRLEGLLRRGGEADAVEATAEAVAAVAGLVPLALVGQPVGDALWLWAEAEGYSGEPPFPRPSVGAQLVHDLEVLADSLRDAGIDPAEVAEEWPDVDAELRSEIRAFARDHAGYGPLAWEAPGFDDPGHVVAALGQTSGRVAPLPRSDGPVAAGDDLVSAVIRLLASWLRMTERGIWLVRSAFHRVIVPRLPAVGTTLEMAPDDVLFIRLPELYRGVGAGVIGARRKAYASNVEYHRKNGTSPRRPAELIAESLGTSP